MGNNRVCPKVRVLTDTEYRKITAEVVFELSYHTTCEEAGRMLGVTEKTVRRARNEETSLDGKTLLTAFWASEKFRAKLLAQVGERAVAVEAGEGCAMSALPATAEVVFKLSSALAADSDGGVQITAAELLSAKDALTAAHANIGGLLNKIAAIEAAAVKGRRAA
jgi:hypothetical protein